MEFLFYCIKVYTLAFFLKKFCKSGYKSQLRGPVFFHPKNIWQTKPHMVSLTKLEHLGCLTLGLFSTTGNGNCFTWFATRMYCKPQVIVLSHSNMLVLKVQRPKCGTVFFGTLEYPTGLKTHGFGALINRGAGFNRFSSAYAINNSCGSIEELINLNKNNKNFINKNLIHIVSDPKTLILAYKSIKNKSKNSTPGFNTETLDGVNLNWVNSTSKLILAGKYKFKPAKRTYVLKKNLEKKKALTISNPNDKIVQQAIYLVLNAIFEPNFLDCSHGSRPGRSAHTALNAVKLKFQGVKWCIENEINNNFSSICHGTLLKILNERIKCQKFLALIKSSIKAGFVENGKFFQSNVGLFQGSIISPILNNIYLNKLDVFILNLCKNFNLGKSRRKSAVFRNIQYQISKTNNPSLKKKLRRKLWRVNSKDPMDPNFKRLYCVRYLDNFILGIVGSKFDAITIKQKVRLFLQNYLKLFLKKSVITHFSKMPIFFLETVIKSNWELNKNIKLIKKNNSLRKVRVTGRPILNAPIKNLFLKATANGFFKLKAGKFIPTKIGWLINLDHVDILKYFNYVINGLLNFYSFANNRKSLGTLIHGLKFSCARTLALKFKLRFASKVFKKFGRTLKCPESKVELFLPSSFRAIKIFKNNPVLPDEVFFKRWSNKLSQSNFFKFCVICGSSYQVEMHHLRKIKDLKARRSKFDFFTFQKAAINRKQIPLCKAHHIALHQNKLTFLERQQFIVGTERLK